MSNRIGKLVKEIQYKTDLTIEQIADRISYSRSHLNKLAKKGDSEKLFKTLMAEFGQEITQNVSRGTSEDVQAPSELITNLLKQQNNLMAILTGVIQEQKEGVVDKVEQIDSNLKDVEAQAESLKLDLVSGHQTILRSLSRLEGKPVDYLVKEAGSTRVKMVQANDESYKKHEKRKIGTGS